MAAALAAAAIAITVTAAHSVINFTQYFGVNFNVLWKVAKVNPELLISGAYANTYIYSRIENTTVSRIRIYIVDYTGVTSEGVT